MANAYFLNVLFTFLQETALFLLWFQKAIKLSFVRIPTQQLTKGLLAPMFPTSLPSFSLPVLIMCARKGTYCSLFFVFLLTVQFTPSWLLSLYITVLHSFTCFLSLTSGQYLKQFLSTIFSLTLLLVLTTNSIFLFM